MCTQFLGHLRIVLHGHMAENCHSASWENMPSYLQILFQNTERRQTAIFLVFQSFKTISNYYLLEA